MAAKGICCVPTPAACAGDRTAALGQRQSVLSSFYAALPLHTSQPVRLCRRREVQCSIGSTSDVSDSELQLHSWLRSPRELSMSRAMLQTAITTATVTYSRQDYSAAAVAAAAVTQYAVVTEGLPLDRAAAEGWLEQLLPAEELFRLRALRQMLALSLTDTAKVLISCPSLMNMSPGDLVMRLLRLRAAMPESNISTLVRRRPQLLMDAEVAVKAGRALKRLKTLMPAYDVERLICEGGETWYSWVAML